MIHKSYSLLLAMLMGGGVVSQAAPLSLQHARKEASRFLQQRGTAFVLHEEPLTMAGEQPLHAFNIDGNHGFVIVGEDRQGDTRILAYSNEGTLDAASMPDAMRYWLELSAESLQHDPASAASASVSAWTHPLLPDSVAPLLHDIEWGQGYPFNEACPTMADGTHYYTGCVATAATQIMRYHEWPASYAWDQMPYQPSQTSAPAAQVSALSALAADFGQAVQMEYLKEGSGASSMLVPGALRNTFGYQSDIRVHRRDYYSSSEWQALICAELANGRPVYYGASSDKGMGGHAFVCDGYDAQGYMHINWGWYGQSNGYFLLNHLDPSSLGIGGGTGGYNRDQEVVTGIAPQSTGLPAQEWPLYGAVRLGVTDYVTEATLMTIVENFDTDKLQGQIAAVVMRHDTLLRVLRQESIEVAGFANNVSGYVNVWMRNIPLPTLEAEDGPCQLRLAIRPNGCEEWQPLRHAIGLPAYADAVINNGQLQIIGPHDIVPQVTLLAPLQQEGPVYAGGAVALNTIIANTSADLRLKEIVIRLTSLADGSHYEVSVPVQIYDESIEPLSLIATLPAEIPAGEYEVTLYEKGHEAHPFDDAQVGRLVLSILPNPSHAVLRMTQMPFWGNTGTDATATQGENLSIACEVRNFGPDGKTDMQCWLTDVDDPSRRYIYHQREVESACGSTATATFYRRLAVDPGNYRMEFSYLLPDGSTMPDESGYQPTITVLPDTLHNWLECVSLSLPDTLYLDERLDSNLTLRAPAVNFSGTVYLRLRQYTNSNGELAYMGSQRINAGEEKSIDFKYRPAVQPGQYMVLCECKMSGVEGTVMNHNLYYREITILSERSAIDVIRTDADSSICYDLMGRPISGTPAVGKISLYKGRKMVIR